MKKLYHGTIYDIQTIDVSKGKGFKDFGKGFYATGVKIHAESIAKRNKRVYDLKQNSTAEKNKGYKKINKQAYRYNLIFDDKKLNTLNVKEFKYADKEWLKFIIANRQCKTKAHNYDIVIGPTADARTTMLLNTYAEVLKNTNYADKVVDELLKELQTHVYPKQYYFGTQRAVSLLRFDKIKREVVL